MSRKTRRCRCPMCGSIFFTDNPTKTYCEESCRKSAENRRYRQARREEAVGALSSS